MNLLRRIFGLDVEESEMPANSLLAEEFEADAPASMDIPGINSEIPNAPPITIDDQQGIGVTRQLPPLESALSNPDQHMLFGQATDVGLVRGNNQDAILTFYSSQGAEEVADFGLFIVADGMGGHHDGEKASAIVTRVIADTVVRRIFLPLQLGTETQSNDEQQTLSEILIDAVKVSNRVVVSEITDGGTTVTAVAVMGDLAYIVHVGDSRAYLVSEDFGLEQITRDHSLVQRLIELDQLTPEEAAEHPQKNVLYRAIGQSDTLEVDAVTRRLPSGSKLLLCSDGLWNHVPDAEILAIIKSADTPQEACNLLVAAANEYGGNDNISAVLLQIPG